MPKVTFKGDTYTCTTAIKGDNYVCLYDEKDIKIINFEDVKDFSAFVITEGDWTLPTPIGECPIAVVGDDGEVHKGGHTCKDIGDAVAKANEAFNKAYSVEGYIATIAPVATGALGMAEEAKSASATAISEAQSAKSTANTALNNASEAIKEASSASSLARGAASIANVALPLDGEKAMTGAIKTKGIILSNTDYGDELPTDMNAYPLGRLFFKKVSG